VNQYPDIVSLQSSISVEKTLNTLKNLLIEHGIVIYTDIDQQAEAFKSGLALKPLQLLIFGNPEGGIPLMNANPLNVSENRFDLPPHMIEKLSVVESMFQKVVSFI
jgi:uncharacterized protein (DUF302 family)